MKNQTLSRNSFQNKVYHATKQIASKVTVRASLLSVLLLVSGGSMTVATLVSSQPSKAIAATAPNNAQVIYVNPTTGADSTNAANNEATPYKTISFALQHASPGAVVQLAPGTYTAKTGEVFPLVVPSSIILTGNESSKGQGVSIVGGDFYTSAIEATQNVTILASPESVISGITITNPNVRGTGIWVESNNATIKNNTFANSKREGIFVTGTATPMITDNVFTKNSGNGITIGQTSKGEIRNNLFQDTGFGISLSEQASPLIANNQMNKNRDGIVAASNTTPVLRENDIENNTEDGVVVISSANPDLGTQGNPGKNIIKNNARYDINNATRGTLIAYGNDINQKAIVGNIDFGSGTIAQVTPPTTTTSAFKDIQGSWAQAYIDALASKKIIAGFEDGTFKPNQPVTRAEFAAIINKAFAPAAQRQAVKFGDVNSKHWAYAPITAAYRGGFVAGYPGNKFAPEQHISKVQTLVALASGLNLRSDNTSVLSFYSDASTIPNYAKPAVSGATQNQLVVNYPTVSKFNPNQEATRAEVAAFVYQALVNSGRASAIPSDYLVKNPLSAQN